MPNENDNKLVTLADLSIAYTALYNRDVVTPASQMAQGLMSANDKAKLDGIESNAQVNPTIVNNLTETVTGKALDATQGKALKDILNSVVLIGSTSTISNGTTTVQLAGLTSDHIVCRWGFSSGEASPPADITVSTSSGSYTITVANIKRSGITMTPVFIKPQN